MTSLAKYSLIVLVAGIFLQSCMFDLHKRTEENIYTKTYRDTTYTHYVHDAPGNEDGGVIHPSTSTIVQERDLINSYDSVLTWTYPDYIRLGLFEAIGVWGGDDNYNLAKGPFGAFPNPIPTTSSDYRKSREGVVTGAIYRFGIYEDRLRPKWKGEEIQGLSYGVHIFEWIIPDAREEMEMIGFPAYYINWRHYFSREVPYQALKISLGFGINALNYISVKNPSKNPFESYYLNISASYDVGSMAGMNFRAYVGYAFGNNGTNSFAIQNLDSSLIDMAYGLNKDDDLLTTSPSLFYAGVGISLLDFINLPEELYVEYKDQPISGLNVGGLEVGLIITSQKSAFSSATISPEDDKIIKGIRISVANTRIQLPIFDYKVYLGTSAVDIIITGQLENLKELQDMNVLDEGTDIVSGAMTFLPIRLGMFWETPLEGWVLEPFMQYAYYPSTYFEVGAKVRARIFDESDASMNVNFNFGYINGNMAGNMDTETLLDDSKFRGLADFSSVYFGVSIGFWDKIFRPEDLRYNK
jgi:hypothetical protein